MKDVKGGSFWIMHLIHVKIFVTGRIEIYLRICEMTEWIKCSERYPGLESDPNYKCYKRYLTFDGIDIGLSSFDNENLREWKVYGITHWMIPPKLPEASYD